MNRDLMVHVTPFEVHVAILEDDVLVEYHVERRRDRSIVGNIYKGRVDKVLPGMQSAFVDVGIDKNAFLYVTDFLEEFSELAETVEDDGVRPPQTPRRPGELPAVSVAAEPVPAEAGEPAEPQAAAAEPTADTPDAAPPPADGQAPRPAGERRGRHRSRRRGRSRSASPDGAQAASPAGQAPAEPAGAPETAGSPASAREETHPAPAPEPVSQPEPASAPQPAPPVEPGPKAEAGPRTERPSRYAAPGARSRLRSGSARKPEAAPAPEPAAAPAPEPPSPAPVPEAPADSPAAKPVRRRRTTRAAAPKKGDGAPDAGSGLTEGTSRITLPDEGASFSQGRSRGRRRRGGGGTGNRNFNTAAENEPGNISSMLKQGQEIIVQVVKEPISLKSARITSHISLPGRMLVFLPTFNRIGVSRKIRSDGERRRLRQIVKGHLGDRSGGFIIRTASEGCTEAELTQDVDFLLGTWQEIQSHSATDKAPTLLYEEPGLVERLLRDRLDESVQTIWVDDEAQYASVVSFMGRFMPAMLGKVKLFNRPESLFEFFNLVPEIQKAMRQKVWLKSGGYIVINHAEAMVAIDVNTGRFVGKNSNFEETITKTNLDAAKEIVRQIRLRNLGGIIVLDFIDMQDKKGRKAVMDVLMQELRKDKAPSKVLSFNDFGLVAMTRKRTAGALEKALSDPCPFCEGNGFVKSVSSTCFDIFSTADRMRGTLKGQTVLIRAHTDVIRSLKGESADVLTEIKRLCGNDVVLVPDPLMPFHAFDISTT
ncbi:MAG: Rne/Rng family ribonuclease [Acidobacteria bacterium]|nr:Rne/Rng family ribonuclease [Acidobacteriota bacterium]